jgi:ribosomal protein S18 acetylase RimI-like enzyme
MNGALRDNTFIAYDNNDQRVGVGAVVEYINEALLPDRPLNYFLTIDGFARARDILFGAVYARARVMRRLKPELAGRIYASCSPRDPERLMFFADMGFDTQDAEYVMRYTLSRDVRPIRPPVGTTLSVSNVRNIEDTDRMLARVNKYSITAHSRGWLEDMMNSPLFAALAVKDDDKYVGEAIITGYGNEGSIVSIYTVPQVRRHGVALALLSAAHEMFMSQGLAFSTAKVWSRFIPATYLFEKAGYKKAAQSMLYPGVNV